MFINSYFYFDFYCALYIAGNAYIYNDEEDDFMIKRMKEINSIKRKREKKVLKVMKV